MTFILLQKYLSAIDRVILKYRLRVADMKYDVIIIGAGLGGLTAGATLAKRGKKVLLIEQHAIPGGCATTFKRKDYVVEVGLHELDGLDKDDSKTEIFKELGVFEGVEFIKLPEFYRYINARVDVVVPDDYREAIDVLIKHFPHEEKGIRKFFKVVIGLCREINRLPTKPWKMLLMLPVFPFLFPNIMFREKQNLGDLMDSIIRDEDLKLVLLANLAYYHDDPYTMSLLFYGTAQGSYFSGGGHFIKGGSQKLSDYLASVIIDNAGEVIYKHMVTAIITENGRAVGVRYKKKSDDDSEIKEASGSFVIANAAIPNVVNELLPPSAARDRLAAEIAGQEIACSLLSIYLGFKKAPKELGNRYYSTFVSGEGLSSQSEWAASHKWDFSKRGYVFVDYSQIDARLAPEGKGLGVIVTVDYLSDWENLPPEEYKAKKEDVAQVLIARLDKLVPGIKDEIEYYEVGTPKTIKRYTLNPQGTAYGFAQTPGQAGRKRIPQRAPIENLYFASAWTMPGHGFSGAIMSGYLCAEAISKK
jgi:phytoene dehydrogenase-like protein